MPSCIHSPVIINPLECRGNYSATSNNMKLVHWPLMVQRGGPEQVAAPFSPLLSVPNVTAHPSTASAPVAIRLYNGLLLCSFNVSI